MTADPLLALAVAAAGGAGAGLRWLVDVALTSRRRGALPWPILVVNVTGCFAFAVLVGLGAESAPWFAVVGTGLLGGYTTFGTVSADSAQLWRKGRRALAAPNALGTLAACAIAATAGLAAGSALA